MLESQHCIVVHQLLAHRQVVAKGNFHSSDVSYQLPSRFGVVSKVTPYASIGWYF